MYKLNEILQDKINVFCSKTLYNNYINYKIITFYLIMVCFVSNTYLEFISLLCDPGMFSLCIIIILGVGIYYYFKKCYDIARNSNDVTFIDNNLYIKECYKWIRDINTVWILLEVLYFINTIFNIITHAEIYNLVYFQIFNLFFIILHYILLSTSEGDNNV